MITAINEISRAGKDIAEMGRTIAAEQNKLARLERRLKRFKKMNKDRLEEMTPAQKRTYNKGRRARKKDIEEQEKEIARLEHDRSSRQLGRGITYGVMGVVGAYAGVELTKFTVKSLLGDISEWEQGMANIEAITGATADQMELLRNSSRTVSKFFKPQEVAESQKFLAMAGLNVGEILKATPSALNLAKAGDLDSGTTADILTNIAGGFENRDFERIANVIAMTTSRANTNIRQLGNAMSYVATNANMAGAEVEEVAAAIGVLSDKGQQASRAGTGISMVYQGLLNPSQKAIDTLMKYGLTEEDVRPRG